MGTEVVVGKGHRGTEEERDVPAVSDVNPGWDLGLLEWSSRKLLLQTLLGQRCINVRLRDRPVRVSSILGEHQNNKVKWLQPLWLRIPPSGTSFGHQTLSDPRRREPVGCTESQRLEVPVSFGIDLDLHPSVHR